MKFKIDISEALTFNAQPAGRSFGNIGPLRGAGWRAGLLSGVAAGALCVAVAPAVAGPDACTVVANVATCSGNHSNGIYSGTDFIVPPVNKLIINNLTEEIHGLGVRWGVFNSNVPIDILSNTGGFAIRSAASGFDLFTSTSASISLDHVGFIAANDDGVRALSLNANGDSGAVSIKGAGNITSGLNGISAVSRVTAAGGGNAGAVSITYDGKIIADTGILAESHVLSGNGNSGAVTIDTKGIITSVTARSIFDGVAGNSGNVSVVHQGLLNGVGVYAESYVGRNGNAGYVVIDNTGDVLHGNLFARSYVDNVGNASAVSIKNAGDINVHSSSAYAIEAQSIVGNAGNSGSVTITNAGNVTGGKGAISAASRATGAGSAGDINVVSTGNSMAGQGIIAGSSAEAGQAGNVSITSAGNITTTLQTGETVALAGASFAEGASGNVVIASTGKLVSANGDGIFAYSSSAAANSGNMTVSNVGEIQAGKYGIWAITKASGAGGNSGHIDIASKGNILAGTAAIVASSLGDASEGDIKIQVEGELRGGRYGVMFEGGDTNSLKIAQGSLVQGGGTGAAIYGTTGDETIDNGGTVVGNVDLGTGVNRFNNLANGAYVSGEIINLDTTGVFHNSGRVFVGGVNAAPITATLTGSVVQDATGILVVDVAGGTADRINVSGTADMAGKLVARFGGMTGTKQQYTIVSADGGLTNNGITGPASTLVMQYELLFPNANDMVLAVTANYVTAGLTPNQKATAQHLQGALAAGGGDLGTVLGYLGGFADAPSYAKALDRLHPEPYLAQTQSVLLSSLTFADGVLTCSDRPGTGTVKLGDDGCGWARIGTSRTTRDRTLENIGFGNDAWSASGGAQFSLAPNWLGTVAFGYERYNISIDDRARSSGDLFQFGAGAMYRNRGLELSGIASAGVGSFDTTRFAVLPGVSAASNNSTGYISGRLRAAYAFGTDVAYVKPMVDFDLTALRRGSFAETGAGSAGLRVNGQTDGVFSLAPAVEVGGQFVIGEDMMLRPFVRGGVRFFTQSDLSATATFIGSPIGVAPFTVSMPLDQTVGEVSSGVELLHAKGMRMGVSYEGRYGSTTQRQMGAFTLRADF